MQRSRGGGLRDFFNAPFALKKYASLRKKVKIVNKDTQRGSKFKEKIKSHFSNMLESLETKETEKLRILHLSKHFIVIDKPFDVIINSDEPDRVSVHSLLKDQFPDLTNDNLKVSTYLYSIQIKGSLVSEDIFNRVLFPCVFGQKALFQVLNKTTLTFSREKTKFQNKNKVILKDIIHLF